MSLTATYLLPNGMKIPKVGFGTWQSKDGEEAYQAVKTALETGYRHIDTAAIYGNEESVGRAIKDSGIDRADLFVTTKLWDTALTTEDAAVEINESLNKLGLDYVDLYLIHWPNPISSRPHFAQRNERVWRAMEQAVRAGKIRAIGTSNFHARHLEPLLEVAEIKPVVNQIMINPTDQQEEIVAFNQAHNIFTEAYSPLGTGKILSIPELQDIAASYKKSVAQVVLRWSLQKGYLPLPKSVTPARIKENADLFDFELDENDIKTIDGFHGIAGLARNPDENSH
ncbi:aldo/keto reductase [Lactococcus fujiensis]|uniref:2,5-diketo-D-gluconic acid reductase n=1 Tax=Lactococcus fujiensis JCM 16395 TaxID=1291764 RepID=A0A2A5RKQ5_9LACT|nr:aldo/keto reductase [Lactococcus fujiensis]PCR99806.1 2,5-diketo-D-gluconic acid reductase [Lactococcus fujiensis JCM 16395]